LLENNLHQIRNEIFSIDTMRDENFRIVVFYMFRVKIPAGNKKCGKPLLRYNREIVLKDPVYMLDKIIIVCLIFAFAGRKATLHSLLGYPHRLWKNRRSTKGRQYPPAGR